MKFSNIALVGTIALLLSASSYAFQVDANAENPPYNFMKQQLENSKAFTVEVFEAMPAEDYSYKPDNDVRTFAAQAYHIAYSLEWYNNTLKGTPIPWAPGDENRMNKEQLVEYVNKQFDAIMETIYSTPINDRFTMGVVSVLDHNSHHRGQMVIYLRMKGIKPPSYR